MCSNRDGMNDGSPTKYYPTLSCLTYTNNQSQAEASSHRQCNCPGRSLPLPSNLEVVSTHPLIRSSTIHTHNNDLQPSPCYSPHKQQLQYKRVTLRVQSRKHYAITRSRQQITSHHIISCWTRKFHLFATNNTVPTTMLQ